jgi:hypothetical protein
MICRKTQRANDGSQLLWVGMGQSDVLTLAFKPMPQALCSIPFRLYQRLPGMASRLISAA